MFRVVVFIAATHTVQPWWVQLGVPQCISGPTPGALLSGPIPSALFGDRAAEVLGGQERLPWSQTQSAPQLPLPVPETIREHGDLERAQSP